MLAPPPSTRQLVTIWITMLLMLSVIAMSDYLRLGPWLPWVQFAAAAVILTLLGFFWMNLRRAPAAVRIAAFVAIFFLFILAFLTFDDYLTRPVDLAPFQPPPSVPAPL